MRKKSNVFSKFKMWKAKVEKEQGCSIKYLKLDKNREFTSREFQMFYEECNIKKHFTIKKNPHKN